MKAMILAAGRGERMRPLTDSCPKPLLEIAGKPLIVYHIEKLVACGVERIVINHAWLGEQLVKVLGDGERFGVELVYSAEPPGALETAGGIAQALPLLGAEPFIVVNGDIWSDFDFARLPHRLDDCLAHLVLVDNPAHNPSGDFVLKGGKVSDEAGQKHTYSGIGVYSPLLFADLPPGKVPLGPLLRERMKTGLIKGEFYHGQWNDIGTPERLNLLNLQLQE